MRKAGMDTSVVHPCLFHELNPGKENKDFQGIFLGSLFYMLYLRWDGEEFSISFPLIIIDRGQVLEAMFCHDRPAHGSCLDDSVTVAAFTDLL